MRFHFDGLKQYDLHQAKKGDKVCIVYETAATGHFNFHFAEVTSVSSKRGDVTFSNKKRFFSSGHQIGVHFRPHFFEVDDALKWRIKEHKLWEFMVRKSISVLEDLPSYGFEKIYSLGDSDLKLLYKVLQKIFVNKENEDG